MKKLVFILLITLMFTGCNFAPTEEAIDLEAQTFNEGISMQDAQKMVEEYIMGMKEYNETNGYHLEQIDGIDAKCPGCYIFKYEYRMRNGEGDDLELTGVANVTLVMFYSQIMDVMYWDDITNEEIQLEVQEEPLIGGQRDEYGCLGPAGYSWCEKKQKCLRVWEEACE